MTWEEIQKAIQENPQLAVQILENVPNITGGKEYLENANKAYFDANVGSYTSDIYNKLDQDIFSVTGLRKEASEKSYDFQKRVLADLKKQAEDTKGNTPDEVKAYKQQIQDLEEKLKNGESSTHWKTSYEEVLQTLQDKEKEFQTIIQEKDQNLLKTNVNVDVAQGLGALKLNQSLPESVRNAMVNQVKSGLMQNAKVIDGKVTYFDEKGTPILDKQHRPATAEYLLKERLSDILEKDAQPGGGASAGSKSEVITTGTGDSATKKLVLDKGSFNTRTEFLKVAEKTLAEQGITRTGNSKEYNAIIDNAHKEYNVSELDRN